jgi:DNA-binding beta-propeller fold protein YncE
MKTTRTTEHGAPAQAILAISLLCLAALIVLAARPGETAEDSSAPPGGKPLAGVLSVVTGYGRGFPFKVPAGIWFDRHREEIYVADRGNHKIAVFDKDGLPLRSFIHYVARRQLGGKVVLQPGEPRSLAVNSRGDIYVVDGIDDALDVLDYRGRSLQRLRAVDLLGPEEEPSAASQPTIPAAVTVDADDRVYVATTGGRCQIAVLDPNGSVLRRFGRSGREKGCFSSVTGLSVDSRGRILVTDAQAVPVQVFSPEGEVLLAFGKHEVGWENFSLPSGIVRDGSGDIWVVDTIRQVVKRFDENGRFLGVIGGYGADPGDMSYPVAVSGDGNRLLFVLEKGGARFQVFEVAS